MVAVIIALCACILISGALFRYIKRKNEFKKAMLPEQVRLVKALVKDLEAPEIDIVLPVLQKKETYRLFQIGKLIDGAERLAQEKYDDYKLFFTSNSVQLLDFNKYINSTVIPGDIKSELKSFQNSGFKKADKESGKYFKIDIKTGKERQNSEIIQGEILYEGDGEVFDTWLNFKESADNLNFVIHQWLSDNNVAIKQSTEKLEQVAFH